MLNQLNQSAKLNNLLICFGTRPEYIKVKSLIDNISCVNRIDRIKLCFTGQHKDLILNQINLSDHELCVLNIDELSNNRLNNIMCNVMMNNYIFDDINYVLVQGDTTSACAMALSAFNNGVKVIHLEAGLRTNDQNDPYPEEMNRQIISRIACIHFCPTEHNKQNLIKENITKNIFVVGNTGLDNITHILNEPPEPDLEMLDKTIVLVTLHRRDNICLMDKWFEVIENIANKYDELQFIIPMHPNPLIQQHKYIFNKVKVIEPLSHDHMIRLVNVCRFVISDSGGLQEECSFLNKRIIVCRRTTERPETLDMTSFMCKYPDDLEEVVDYVCTSPYTNNEICPYGDGNSWKKIVSVLNMIF